MDEATRKQIQANVDWLFLDPSQGGAGNKPPTQLAGWVAPVRIGDGTVPAIRGWIGAKTCGRIAVLYAVIGRKDAALVWLVAGQWHNQAVKDQFAAHSDYAIEYAVGRWLSESLGAAATGGLSEQLSTAKALLASEVGSHNPPPNAPKEKPDPEPREGGGGGHGAK